MLTSLKHYINVNKLLTPLSEQHCIILTVIYKLFLPRLKCIQNNTPLHYVPRTKSMPPYLLYVQDQ